VDAMQNGTLTIAQKVILPMVLKGLQLRHPALNLDDYLHGVVARSIDVFLACEGDDSSVRGIIAEGAPASDFTPTTPRAADQLREWFGAEALPRGGSSAAMMGCSAGEVIDAQVAPGQGHGILDLGSAPQDWTRGRFEGTVPPNSCAIG
jgi:hypothetical protein